MDVLDLADGILIPWTREMFSPKQWVAGSTESTCMLCFLPRRKQQLSKRLEMLRTFPMREEDFKVQVDGFKMIGAAQNIFSSIKLKSSN